jgi:flagellin
MSAHGLSNGTKGMITTTAGGATASTVVHVKKLDANTYELYTNADLATGKVNFSAAVSDQSFRLAIDESAVHVVINDKGNELKKGMFLTTNPGTTGEDPGAIAAKSGDVVSINKATQDISTFATELNTDYDDVNLRSVESSQIALTLVKLAITQVATDRAKLGAVQSRLNFTNEQLTVTKENLSAAISRIADVDVAEEATNYARYQILVASGTEMLKQANQLPQSALQLLR